MKLHLLTLLLSVSSLIGMDNHDTHQLIESNKLTAFLLGHLSDCMNKKEIFCCASCVKTDRKKLLDPDFQGKLKASRFNYVQYLLSDSPNDITIKRNNKDEVFLKYEYSNWFDSGLTTFLETIDKTRIEDDLKLTLNWLGYSFTLNQIENQCSVMDQYSYMETAKVGKLLFTYGAQTHMPFDSFAAMYKAIERQKNKIKGNHQ